MAGNRAGPGKVVAADEWHIQPRENLVDKNDQSRPGEIDEGRTWEACAAEIDHAVKSLRAHDASEVFLALYFRPCHAKCKEDIVLIDTALHALSYAREERIAQIGYYEPDRSYPIALEASSRVIGGKADFRDQPEDMPLRVLGDIAALVDDGADGSDRNARLARDIADRRTRGPGDFAGPLICKETLARPSRQTSRQYVRDQRRAVDRDFHGVSRYSGSTTRRKLMIPRRARKLIAANVPAVFKREFACSR